MKHIYFVIGNNDLAGEQPTSEGIRRFSSFMRAVAAQLDSNRIVLHDLTRCYADTARTADGGCIADLADVRLVGLETASFKNAPASQPVKVMEYAKDLRSSVALTPAVQAWDSAVVERLDRIITDAGSRKVLVITHEPDLDDPYALSVIRTRIDSVPADSSRFEAAIWNVDGAIHQRWTEVVTRSNVLGVLAGHLHSPNRGDYVQPYPSSAGTGRPDPMRLFVSPPLAVKNQADAPRQARGLSLYRISGDSIRRQIVWMDLANQLSGPAQTVNPQEEPVDLSLLQILGVILFAAIAASGGILTGYKGGVREWQENAGNGQNFTMVEHFWYIWSVVSGIVGLVAALALFANDWTDRSGIAVWFAATFALTWLLMWFLIRRLK